MLFIWNFVHVLLKHSNMLLECVRHCSRHLCLWAGKQDIFYNYTVFSPGRADSTLSASIFFFFFSSKLWHKTWYTTLSHSLEWQKCSQFQKNNLDFKNKVNVGKNYIFFCIYNVQRNSLSAIKQFICWIYIKCLRKSCLWQKITKGTI